MHQVGTLSLEQFATTEAIQCTEVFEFVRRLTDPTFAMPTLQPYRCSSSSPPPLSPSPSPSLSSSPQGWTFVKSQRKTTPC